MIRNGFLTLAAFVALTGAALAADVPSGVPDGLRGGFQTEFGTRTWLGFGTTAKNLYDTGGGLVSRLTYGSVPVASGELFGKATVDDFFISAYAGLGWQQGGTLTDEDFPPFKTPYSSTDSNQRNGSLGYATIDLGRNFVTTSTGRLGAFVGYNYLNQQLNAYGCTQNATNMAICVPSISDGTEGISQSNTWQSVRVGLSGDLDFGDHWSINGDGAILPYVHMSGADTHWLRIPSDFTGPIPEDGNGWGVQMQAMLDYKVNDRLSLGLGGRYWHMQTTTGTAHFEGHTAGGGGVPQPLTWSTDVMGLLAEAKATF